jgi:acyl-CoA reductase-like NAD-dependent aldehyde dehydrogenase
MATSNSATTATVHLIINGKDVIGPSTFAVDSPLTSETIYECSSAGVPEALSAVAAAQEAFPQWSRTKPANRRNIFLKAASILSERRDEVWECIHNETGVERSFFTISLETTVEMIKDTAGKIATAVESYLPVIGEVGSSAVVYKEPYGVVLGIAPW